jgi:hypothetical protein
MKTRIYILFIIGISLLFSCLKNVEEFANENNTIINLQWNKAYADDTIEKARLGLSWCYSMVGAKVLNSVVLSSNDSVFTVNINAIALDENALTKIKILHSKIIETEAYKQTKTIDLGRYISLLIGTSEHYYSITNIPNTLDEILSNYNLKPSKGYVNNSTVSLKHRIIEYSNQEESKQLFLSNEIAPQTNEIVEYETIEIMENGQLKFGIFDENKNRVNVANNEHTTAGKPAKCMWCHESNINQLFSPQDNFSGYLTSQQLNDTLVMFNNELREQQNLLIDGVKFSNRQEHVLLELAYITFMEPSALRLANEWKMSEIEVQNLLNSLPTHTHHEFPFLGTLYDRNDVDEFAPYKSLVVSTSVREASATEVNHID